MEIMIMRDLIQDELGNYYTVSKIDGNRLTLVNAMIHHSFRRILGEEFLKDVNQRYDNKHVAVGQYFQDSLKNRIDGLSSGKYPGGIYKLSDVQKEYEIEVDVFYEKDVSVN